MPNARLRREPVIRTMHRPAWQGYTGERTLAAAFGVRLRNDCVVMHAERNPYHRLIAAARSRRQLIHVHWELTHRCSERCTHCYLVVLPSGRMPPGELRTDECLAIVDQMAELGVLSVTFSGGEFLTRRDWFAIARHARERRLALRLFTNGLAVTERVARQIAALHPLRVEVSLYGPDAELHEAVTRVRGSFARTCRGLKLLHALGVHTVVKTPLLRANIRRCAELAALAETLGAAFQVDPILTPRLDGGQAALAQRVAAEDLQRLMERTLDTAQWPLPAAEAGASPAAAPCGIGSSSLLIDPYGNVFPCVEVRQCMGNLRREPLRAIWENAAAWESVQRELAQTPAQCTSCPVLGYCIRCPGMARNEHGKLGVASSAHCAAAWARCRAIEGRTACGPHKEFL